MKKYENLVAKGGGVLVVAYCGSYKFLEENNIVSSFKRCSGTSGGSIFATLFCLGYTSDEIYEILKVTDFNKFKDGFNLLSIFKRYGIYGGDVFLSWIKTILKNKGYSEDITFSDLNNLVKKDPSKYKDLYVFALNLNTRNIEGFSFDRTPNVKIVEAVRASMSIPLFFNSYKIDSLGTQDIYVDGGVSYNYPMSVFDNEQFLVDNSDINEYTIGLYLGNLNKKNINNGLKYWEPINYTKELFNSIIESEDTNFKKRLDDVRRSVFIDIFGISSTDFAITQDQVKELYESGYNSIKTYFQDKI